LLVFEELLPGERLLVELNFDEFFFGAFLAGCAFLGCRTLVRFWSSVIDRTQAEPMSIRIATSCIRDLPCERRHPIKPHPR
jgi:hypothetical protein